METQPLFSWRRPLSLILSLVLFITMMAVALPVNAAKDSGKLIQTAVTGESNYKMALEVLELVNAQRKKAGLGKLEMDKTMQGYAMQRAAECSLYYQHVRPNGEPWHSIIKEHKGAAENIAAGYFTAEDVMNGWMNSPGHKANILTKDYQSIGIGVFKLGKYYYWCQLFNGLKKQSTPTQKKPVTETFTIEAQTTLLNLGINTTKLALKNNQTATLKVTNLNRGFEDEWDPLDPSGFTYVPEKSGVVTISKAGVVTPIGNGSTTISVKSKNGVKLFTVSVTAEVKNAHTKHDYTAATCIAPQTCTVCGVTKGKALGHTYDNACDAQCNACDASRQVGNHTWGKGICSACGTASPSKVTITTEPKTTYARQGAKATVQVVATGEGLSYAWYIKNNGGKKYSKSSVTKDTYSVTMGDATQNRYLYCIITDKYGNEVKTKTVCVRRQVTITSESATAAYAQKDKKVSVKITAAGDGLKYQWYIKNDGASKYSKSSVTSATYSTTMGTKVKNRRVYCVVTDKYGKTVQSKTFILRESVSIVTEPKTVTVANNKTAKVTVKASGDGLKYTWYIKNAGASKYSKSSVTSATYSTTMNSKSKNRLVYCVVTDKYGKTVKTATIKLKMK